MRSAKFSAPETVRSDRYWVLLIVVLSPLGLLTWAGLAFAIYWPVSVVLHWSVSTAWAVVGAYDLKPAL